MITLTGEQLQVVDKVVKWFKEGEEKDFPEGYSFRFCGYAGTGKTTTMKSVLQALKEVVADYKIHCVAPTGKAAQVLRKKLAGLAEVSTVHLLLYNATKDENGQLTWKKVIPDGSMKGHVIVLDEASMAGVDMIRDLHATGAMLLAVGDVMQLPPVKQESWLLQVEPDAMLETIHRQALENPIIRLSMKVRQGGRVEKRDNCAEIQVVDYLREVEGWETKDQILVGTNLQRNVINLTTRKKLFGETSPGIVEGEKLVCLRNVQLQEAYVANGQLITSLGEFKQVHHSKGFIEGAITLAGEDRSIIVRAPFEILEGAYGPQPAPVVDMVSWNRNVGSITNLDYGYALTVHKFQGSEERDIVVVDGKIQMRDKKFRAQWLYTAVTRAVEKLRFVL